MTDIQRADAVVVELKNLFTAAYTAHYHIHGRHLHFNSCPEPNCTSWRDSIHTLQERLIDGEMSG